MFDGDQAGILVGMGALEAGWRRWGCVPFSSGFWGDRLNAVAIAGREMRLRLRDAVAGREMRLQVARCGLRVARCGCESRDASCESQDASCDCQMLRDLGEFSGVPHRRIYGVPL